ncbi:unnamed protein product [Eruca vesicaria subsp. sativa]|uniref:Uncharacterized protein n=1 Tax=Eruca vesicaria subsp. sativa TaxID=29727 RepID=A0ABC8LFJ0_ERUVS|nr:unnamed protein product [Eruca vesicaria subsp. sativa]
MSTVGEIIVVSRCHKLLDMRNFTGARSLVKMKKQLGKDWPILDQVEAICDVIIAAENRLPNRFMDYYGMIRLTRFEPVVLDDFKRLMKLLDWRCHGLPSSKEAAHYAFQAWSLLSKPVLKDSYDLDISSPMVHLGFPEGSSFVPKEQNPNQNTGRGNDNEVVVISDDEDEGDENQEVVTMFRTSKLCKINGKRVKLIPVKKKTKDSSTSNVKKT